MELSKDVKLIEYSKRTEFFNTLTHIIGVIFSLTALIFSLIKVSHSGPRYIISACIYCLSFLTVYTMSSVYHGLPKGEAKRKARLFDHIAIPLLLAGTATPCALITLHNISLSHSILVFCLAWFCAAFGIITKLFFFSNEKLKVICMAVYFIGGAIMLLSNLPLLGNINKTAFLYLVIGCLFYTVGAVFCNIGIKHPAFHPVFHIFVLAGSIIHFLTIYIYVF